MSILFLLCFGAPACTAEIAETDEPSILDGVGLDETSDPLAARSHLFWRAAYHEQQTTIPVCFEPDAYWSAAEKQSIETLASKWEVPGGVDFRFSTTPCQRGTPGIHVGRERVAGNCYAMYGTGISGVYNGMRIRQPYSPNCVTHEFGHALGFLHEMDRNDSTCTAGRGQGTPDLYLTPYDHNSIMNYCTRHNDLTLLDAVGVLSIYGGDIVALHTGKVALRSAAGPHLSWNSRANRLETANGIGAGQKWQLASDSAGPVSYGQAVTIRSLSRSDFLGVLTNSTGTRTLGFVAAETSAQWRVQNAFTPSLTGTAKVNEPVILRHSSGVYLSRDSMTGLPRLSTTAGGLGAAQDAWRFQTLMFAP